MKRLFSKTARSYVAKGDLERLIGYIVTRSSGLRLDKQHFDEITERFNEKGGTVKGIQGKTSEDKGQHYEILHGAIDYVLTKHKLNK